MLLPIPLLATLSFLIGSIPIGYLLARYCYGVDIRKHGSGNIGATNVGRTLGKNAGTYTLIGDVTKGAIAALLGALCTDSGAQVFQLFCGFCAVCGHCYSPFLRFNGGKGVATACGVFLIAAPLSILFVVATFVIVVYTTKIVSLGSLAGSIAMLIYMWIAEPAEQPLNLVLTGSIAGLIYLRHKENIRRLVQREESKLGSSQKTSATPTPE